MSINYDFEPVLTGLARTNKNAAEDLIYRIDKKEIKFIGDFILLTNSIDSLPKK